MLTTGRWRFTMTLLSVRRPAIAPGCAHRICGVMHSCTIKSMRLEPIRHTSAAQHQAWLLNVDAAYKMDSHTARVASDKSNESSKSPSSMKLRTCAASTGQGLT